VSLVQDHHVQQLRCDMLANMAVNRDLMRRPSIPPSTREIDFGSMSTKDLWHNLSGISPKLNSHIQPTIA
jgi:hypothetical protein